MVEGNQRSFDIREPKGGRTGRVRRNDRVGGGGSVIYNIKEFQVNIK